MNSATIQHVGTIRSPAARVTRNASATRIVANPPALVLRYHLGVREDAPAVAVVEVGEPDRATLDLDGEPIRLFGDGGGCAGPVGGGVWELMELLGRGGSSSVPAWTRGQHYRVPSGCVGHSIVTSDRQVTQVHRRRHNRRTAASPSGVPGQCFFTASGPARRVTERRTSATMMASSA